MTNLEQIKIVSDKLKDISQAYVDYEAFFYLVPIPMCIASSNGYFLNTNNEWAKFTEYTEIELCSSPWLDFVHPDDVEKTMNIERSMGHDHVNNFVNRYKKKNGGYVKVRWVASSYKNNRTYCVCEMENIDD